MTDPSLPSPEGAVGPSSGPRPSLPSPEGAVGPSSAQRPSTSSEPTGEELAQLRAELAELRAEVARLDADLDESRRLNLRAAELLDIVYESLGRTQGPTESRH